MITSSLSAAAAARLDPVVLEWYDRAGTDPLSVTVRLDPPVGPDDLAFFAAFDPGTRPGFSVMIVTLDRAQLRALAENPKVRWVNLPGVSEPF